MTAQELAQICVDEAPGAIKRFNTARDELIKSMGYDEYRGLFARACEIIGSGGTL